VETGPGTDGWLEDTRASYDTVADSYADLTRHLLDETPEERAVLALFADMVRAHGGGTVADVGCGPGRITAYLRQLGVDAFGIDLSPGMIEVARRDHPGLRFDLGSMTDLALDQMTAWLNDAGFAVEAYRTLTSAESKLGGVILARRQATDPAR
jgi:SAM-dependent methyltransferase